MSEEYTNLSNDELHAEISDSLDEYIEWVNKEIPLDDSWDPEIFYLVGLREDLYQYLQALTCRGISFNTAKIDKVDQLWRQWAKNNTSIKYKYNFKRDDEPKIKWWWWLDELSKKNSSSL